jgi:hypothetical protein
MASTKNIPQKKIEKLPVLEALLASKLAPQTSSTLKKTAVVYIHHALYSSISVIKAMIKLGVKPQNIFVLGKHYSECKEVVDIIKGMGIYYQPCSTQIGIANFFSSFVRDVNWLWLKVIAKLQRKNVSNIIILDHGGYGVAFAPPEILRDYNLVGIEKTTCGLKNPLSQGFSFPIIELASCAVKKILESPLIADAVVNKLLRFIPIQGSNLICGVIGYGAIGKAVSDKLLALGHQVIIYDNEQHQIQGISKEIVAAKDCSSLIFKADYIFGCSGKEIAVSGNILEDFLRNKTFISCSSEDIEFLPMLRFIRQSKSYKISNKPLSNIIFKTKKGIAIKILRGGFPVNFDNSGVSVAANEIQLTRALAVSSVIQAANLLTKPRVINHGGRYMLDPELQRFVALEWFKYQIKNIFPNVKDKFKNLRWIRAYSGGIYKKFK